MLFLTQKLLRAILQTLITNLSPVVVPLKSCPRKGCWFYFRRLHAPLSSSSHGFNLDTRSNVVLLTSVVSILASTVFLYLGGAQSTQVSLGIHISLSLRSGNEGYQICAVGSQVPDNKGFTRIPPVPGCRWSECR